MQDYRVDVPFLGFAGFAGILPELADRLKYYFKIKTNI